jgi:hypothetical protein
MRNHLNCLSLHRSLLFMFQPRRIAVLVNNTRARNMFRSSSVPYLITFFKAALRRTISAMGHKETFDYENADATAASDDACWRVKYAGIAPQSCTCLGSRHQEDDGNDKYGLADGFHC